MSQQRQKEQKEPKELKEQTSKQTRHTKQSSQQQKTDIKAIKRESIGDSSEDLLSKLRCSSLPEEDIQSRQNRRDSSRGDNKYPGLAFGAPGIVSNTIFKFNLISNEIADIKQNHLRKVCFQSSTGHL